MVDDLLGEELPKEFQYDWQVVNWPVRLDISSVEARSLDYWCDRGCLICIRKRLSERNDRLYFCQKWSDFCYNLLQDREFGGHVGGM
jgi:hypothetical protein